MITSLLRCLAYEVSHKKHKKMSMLMCYEVMMSVWGEQA